jgi:hypothetical protein
MYKISMLLLSFLFISGCTFEVDDSTDPRIVLLGDPELTYDINSTKKNELLNYYLLPGTNPAASFTATDNITKNLTFLPVTMTDSADNYIDITNDETISNLFKTESIYTITYAVEDEAGNKAEVTRAVIIKDVTPPTIQLTQLHPSQANINNYPIPQDVYSLLVPASTTANIVKIPRNLFFEGVTIKDVWTQASGSTPESLSPYDSDVTKAITFFPLPHAASSDTDVVFMSTGTYVATYTAIDKNGNTSETTRNIKVALDVSPPVIITTDLYHQRLTNTGSDAEVSIDSTEKATFLSTVLTRDLVIQEDFLPYSLIKNNPLLLEFAINSDLYKNNTTDLNLITPTTTEGFQLPIIATDISGNTSPEFLRTIVFADNAGPILQSMPSTSLLLELDANANIDTIMQSIIALSTDVIFTDETAADVVTIVTSVVDENGSALDTLIYDDLSSNGNVYTITYDATDGFQYSSTDILNRQRSLTVVDTTPPVISFPNFSSEYQLFLSFPTSLPNTYFDSIKTDLINMGDLLLTDNSTNSVFDITLSSSIVSTSNASCAIVGQPLDLSCSGEHTIILSAIDSSNNSSSSSNLKIYIYDSQDKIAFDEIVENIDGVYSFTDEITDLFDLTTNIEDLTTNQTFNSQFQFPPQTTFDLSPFMHYNYVPTTSISPINVDLDYTVTVSNNISVISTQTGAGMETTAIFSKPSPNNPDLQLSIPTDITSPKFVNYNLDIRIAVGTYVSKISLPIEIRPFINNDISNVLAIKIIPKFAPDFAEDNPDNLVLNDFSTEQEANDLSDTLFLDGYDFNINNSQGLYKITPSAYQTNNFIQQDGVSIFEVDNSYETKPMNNPIPDPAITRVTALIDENGIMHRDIAIMVKAHINNIINTNSNIQASLENAKDLTTSALIPSDFKIILLPQDDGMTHHQLIDSTLDAKKVCGQHCSVPLEYSSTNGTWEFYKSLIDIPTGSIYFCSIDHYERGIRQYLSFDVLCNIATTPTNTAYYERDDSFTDPAELSFGQIGEANQKVYIYLNVKTETTDDAGEPVTEEEPNWCEFNTSTRGQLEIPAAGCLDKQAPGNVIPLIEYDGASTAYKRTDDPITSELSDVFTPYGVSGYSTGVLSSFFFGDSFELSTGNLLTKFINSDLIPTLPTTNITSQPVMIRDGNLVAPHAASLLYPTTSPYLLPTETKLSFYSSGFLFSDLSDLENVVNGSKPSNMSAIDKVISGIIQPYVVGIDDMKINNKVYLFDLNSQNPVHNDQHVIKIPLVSPTQNGELEYLLIEKRVNSGNDNISILNMEASPEAKPLLTILSNTADELAWDNDDSGFVAWHVELENPVTGIPAISVKSETKTHQLIGDNFVLGPISDNGLPSTNTNSNEETGIIIKVIGVGLDKKIKVCHVNTGALDIDDPLYDADCKIASDI